MSGYEGTNLVVLAASVAVEVAAAVAFAVAVAVVVVRIFGTAGKNRRPCFNFVLHVIMVPQAGASPYQNNTRSRRNAAGRRAIATRML